MAALPVQDKIFPFACKNLSCSRRLYDIDDFIQVALLWGFIYFTSNEYQIIGLTCPNCFFTSIRKFTFDSEIFSIELLENRAPDRDFENNKINVEFRGLVPFSKKILYRAFYQQRYLEAHHININLEQFSANIPLEAELFPEQFLDQYPPIVFRDADNFIISEKINVLALDYPKFVKDELPYTFNESYIEHLCNIENTQDVKAIPRVVSNYNIYQYSDVWLRSKPNKMLYGVYKERIYSAFERVFNFQNVSNLYLEMLGSKEIAEYKKVMRSFLGRLKVEESLNFSQKLADFFRVYSRGRNIKRYETKFKNKILLNFKIHGIDDVVNIPLHYLFYDQTLQPIYNQIEKNDYLPESKSKPDETPPKLTKVVKPKVKRKSGRATKSEIKEMELLEKHLPALQAIKSENREMIKLKMALIEENRKNPKKNVLITGETGVGKELFAAAAHEVSRKGKSFLPVNCTAIAETLLDSELFGHKKGSFTGATHEHIGKFKAARGGTIFLDEIGEISELLQKKLLRAIENHEIQPVGGLKPEKIDDVKMVFATNKDLDKERRNGNFRDDLYFRIASSYKIPILPLRERKEDIPLLASHFIYCENEKLTEPLQKLPDIDKDVLDILAAYEWPGNVRELKSDIEQVFSRWLGSHTETISKNNVPKDIITKLSGQSAVNEEKLPPKSEKIRKANLTMEFYLKNKANKNTTAKELQIDRKTVLRQLRDLPQESKSKVNAFEVSIGKEPTDLH